MVIERKALLLANKLHSNLSPKLLILRNSTTFPQIAS